MEMAREVSTYSQHQPSNTWDHETQELPEVCVKLRIKYEVDRKQYCVLVALEGHGALSKFTAQRTGDKYYPNDTQRIKEN